MPERSLAPRPPWEGRRVVLGVTGGIAAYKSIQLARDLTRLGAEVDVILSRAARKFVGRLSFSGVTGRPVLGRLLSTAGAALHLRLAEEADVVAVAPATADLIARAAQGRADDLITTVLLATRAPVLLAPAMNDAMWEHPQTLANVEHCRDRLGYAVLGPAEGALAVGEGSGRGRMLEPTEICDHVGRALAPTGALSGREVVVTAGPTREPIDPVRYVGNRSSGRMGFALAREAWLRGAKVSLVTGPSELADPVGVRTLRVETAREMLQAVEEIVPDADFLFFAAAVSDFRPRESHGDKLKRADAGGSLDLRLVENPDVAADTRSMRAEGAFTVGFALETEGLEEGALAKMRSKGFDMVVANDPGDPGAGFEVDTNQVTLFFADGQAERLPLETKDLVAARILDHVQAARTEGS